jgi:hypothetical protein
LSIAAGRRRSSKQVRGVRLDVRGSGGEQLITVIGVEARPHAEAVFGLVQPPELDVLVGLLEIGDDALRAVDNARCPRLESRGALQCPLRERVNHAALEPVDDRDLARDLLIGAERLAAGVDEDDEPVVEVGTGEGEWILEYLGWPTRPRGRRSNPRSSIAPSAALRERSIDMAPS